MVILRFTVNSPSGFPISVDGGLNRVVALRIISRSGNEPDFYGLFRFQERDCFRFELVEHEVAVGCPTGALVRE